MFNFVCRSSFYFRNVIEIQKGVGFTFPPFFKMGAASRCLPKSGIDKIQGQMLVEIKCW